MRIVISGKDYKVEEALKARIEKKVGKMQRYFAEEAEAQVRLSLERGARNIAEITLKMCIRDRPNVVLTPHIGANTVETRVKMARACQARILLSLIHISMVGMPNFSTSMVSGPSGPKLPRNSTSALHPAAFSSSNALRASFSFSIMVSISAISPPFAR